MFRRPLVVVDIGATTPVASAGEARLAVFPDAERLAILIRLETPVGAQLGPMDLDRIERVVAEGDRARAAVTRDLDGLGLPVETEVAFDDAHGALDRAVRERSPDAIVFLSSAQPVGKRLREASDLAVRASLPVVLVGDGLVGIPPLTFLHPFDGKGASLAALGAFLRDRSAARWSVELLALSEPEAGLASRLGTLKSLAGTEATLSLERADVPLLGQEGSVTALVERADAILVPTDLGISLVARRAERLVLRSKLAILLPPVPLAERSGQLVTSDGLVVGAETALRLERVSALGGPRALEDGAIEVVTGGRSVGRLACREGTIRIPVSLVGAGSLGLGRPVRDDASAEDPLAWVETSTRLVAPEARPVLLVDAAHPADVVARARARLSEPERLVVAVRLDESQALSELRLRFAELEVYLVDGRDLIEEGPTDDVPREARAVRLARCAARLRGRGVRVDAVIPFESGKARELGFAVLDAEHLKLAAEHVAHVFVEPPSAGDAFERRLRAVTGTEALPGNSIAFEIDNAVARKSLIDAIDRARERVHCQWYIVEDDDVGRAIEEALGRAATRGVTVRVLVDSLWGRHGSYGQVNPLVDRLAKLPGLEVFVANKLSALPGLDGLKRRDHRKIITVDGAIGLVGGRNLGHTYYAGFDEVALAPTSPQNDVPWVDASVRVEGPAVRAMDESFRAAWLEAGGRDFGLKSPKLAGDLAARVVVHSGLRDACTLDAYLSVIDEARSTIDIVHAFPLQLELRAALLRAVHRGVRLRFVLGRVRPVYGDEKPFPGLPIRDLADAIIRGRLDELLIAGAKAYEIAIPARPGWDPTLGKVRPEVHAKLLLADGRITAVGSANLDVTAGYWESEILLVVDDLRFAATVQRGIDELLAVSEPIDPDAAPWRDSRAIRGWLSDHWPSVIG